MATFHQQFAVLPKLEELLADDPFWAGILGPLNQTRFNLHLAIFREPYLRFIMEGRKTVETRFAKCACAPYGRVSDGDVLLLKRSGGAVVAVCVVQKVWFYRLEPDSLNQIRQRFGAAICPAGDSFWEDRADAAYATLMLIDHVTPVENIEIKKRDRRGWVMLESPRQKLLMCNEC